MPAGGRVRVAVAVRPLIVPGSLAGGAGRLAGGAATRSSAPS